MQKRKRPVKEAPTKIKDSLCFRNPKEVYTALTENKEVKCWLNFISNHYIPNSAKVLLFYPCSAKKPYNVSRSYRKLYETLAKLGNLRNEIHVVTVSEPFGLVPEEFYGKKSRWHNWEESWYDCPGLFEWWCRKNSQPYSKEIADKCIDILASHVASFLKKAEHQYSTIIAFVRSYTSRLKITDSLTHRRIIEKASKISSVPVKILPSRGIITKIVREKGFFAWDRYGVAHPLAQQYLLDYLRELLRELKQ